MNIDYMRCLKALVYKLPLALIIGVAMGIIGAVVCYFVLDHENQYTARSSAYTQSDSAYGNAAEGVQYAEVAKSITVADRAAKLLGNTTLNKYDIYNMVTVEFDNESSYVNSSAVINIYATTTDYQLSIDVVNAVTQAFVDEISFIISGSNQVSVLDEASTSAITYDAQKQFVMYVGIIAAAGFFIVCLIAVLLEVLSLKLTTVSDGTLYGKLNVIGVIPNHTEV